MYHELRLLEGQVRQCRDQAMRDTASACHQITSYSSHGGHEPLLVVPAASALPSQVGVLTVGINPRWTKRTGDSCGETPRGQLDGPKAFDSYKETILGGLPNGTGLAHVELVQCGTPSGKDVSKVITLCRGRFFDKVVLALRPRVIVPIGKWAAEHLYWYNTASGMSGIHWAGIRRRHGTSEKAVFGDHECSLVFVLQPSAYVSTCERNAAREAIAQAYRDQA